MASAGDWSVFVTRPISLVFLLVSIVSVIVVLRQNRRAKKGGAKAEDAPLEEEA
jgi:putative tricarboxylic transport membrane protein